MATTADATTADAGLHSAVLLLGAERGHQCPSWRYHLVDVETLAAGALHRPPPWSFDELLAAFELSYREEDRHTALGDARLVRDLYDAVLGRLTAAAILEGRPAQ